MSAAKIQNAASTTPRTAADAVPAPEARGESFGAFLIRERELRGISLDQIADETRILVANLRALEEDDRSRLPERVFVLGYIRAYAKAIGIDPNEAVLRYDEYLQGREPPAVAMALQLPCRERRASRGIALAAALLLALAIAVIACLWMALGTPGATAGALPTQDGRGQGALPEAGAPARPAIPGEAGAPAPGQSPARESGASAAGAAGESTPAGGSGRADP